MLHPLKGTLSLLGFDLRKRTPKSELLGLMSSLWPKSIGVDLTRIGGSQDGAYLLPDMISGHEVCISPGVGDSVFLRRTFTIGMELHPFFLITAWISRRIYRNRVSS
jgi:hypothetical protein